MSLYKRRNVYWSAVYVDGVRHLRSLETTNRRKAETREEAIKDELRARHFQLPELRPEMTFDELYTRFLAEGGVRPHHIERAKHFLPFFGDLSIGRITKNEAIRYRKQRQNDHLAKQNGKNAPRPLSEATVNRDISVVRHLLYWAADEGFIQQNPFARVRMARERRKRRPVMPVAEEVKLLSVCAPHLVPIVVLALDTGMRRGELLHQHWEDVDFDRRLLFVTHSKTPEGEMREVPLTTRAFDLLTALRRPQGLLFTYRKSPIRDLKTSWAAAIRRAGIAHYRFHDLRHTFNSRLVEAEVIADVRKELMGHSRGGDVHSIYTHVELPLLREAIRRLEAWHSAKLDALATITAQGGPSDVRPALPATT